MKKNLNVAIIGFGGMGSWHCNNMRESGFVNVVGVYDVSEERRRAAESLGLRNFISPLEAAVVPEVDAVLISTPNDLHLPYAEFFAPKGKHIVCEKPATLRAEDFERMTEIAERSGVLLAVHQNRRWDPDFLTLRKLKETGGLGEIYLVESSVTGSHGIPGDWRKQRARGGGMMLDWGVHLIDQLLQFDVSPVVSVDCDLSFCEGFDVDDGFTLTLKFESGLKAVVNVDTNCFVNRPRWRIQGLDGTAVIENWSREGKVVRVREREDRFLKGIDAGNGFTRTMADRSAVTVEELPLPGPMPEPFAFYREVLDGVNGKPISIRPAEVLRVLRVMERALKGQNGPCRL